MNTKEILDILRPGDIVNFDSRPRWYQFWLWVIYAQIRRYQRRKWGRKSRYRDIHSALYLGDNRFLSVESPRTVICDLEHLISKRTKSVRICRYNRESFLFQQNETSTMYRAALDLEGTAYDYGQLLDMLVRQLGAGFIPRKLTVFDFGRKRKVCSVGVHLCLIKWWRSLDETESRKLRRPLGRQWVEDTCPADFANHPTFVVVKEQR